MNIGYACLHISFLCPPLAVAVCNYRCRPAIHVILAVLLSLSHLTLFIYTIIGLCVAFTHDFPEEAHGLLMSVQICVGVRTMIYGTCFFLVFAHYMKCILSLEEEEEI